MWLTMIWALRRILKMDIARSFTASLKECLDAAILSSWPERETGLSERGLEQGQCGTRVDYLPDTSE